MQSIPIKPLIFNRDSLNLHEQWTLFREQCQFLLIDGPYPVHTEPACIAAVLKARDKKNLLNVLEVLGGHFKPTHSVLQSWCQLGSVYSSQCKDQMEFLIKLKDVAADCSFLNKKEVIKVLFLIHNINERVKDYLIENTKPENTLANVLQ